MTYTHTHTLSVFSSPCTIGLSTGDLGIRCLFYNSFISICHANICADYCRAHIPRVAQSFWNAHLFMTTGGFQRGGSASVKGLLKQVHWNITMGLRLGSLFIQWRVFLDESNGFLVACFLVNYQRLESHLAVILSVRSHRLEANAGAASATTSHFQIQWNLADKWFRLNRQPFSQSYSISNLQSALLVSSRAVIVPTALVNISRPSAGKNARYSTPVSMWIQRNEGTDNICFIFCLIPFCLFPNAFFSSFVFPGFCFF